MRVRAVDVSAATWRRLGFPALLISLMVASPQAPAKVYKWADEKGNVHYSSTRPPGQTTKTLDVDTGPKGTVPEAASAGEKDVDAPVSPEQGAAYLKSCVEKICERFRESDPRCESPECQAHIKRINPWDGCTAPICAKVQALDPKCQTSMCTRAQEANQQCAVNRILCVAKSQEIEKDLARRQNNTKRKAEREALSKLRADARGSGRRADYNKYLVECRRQGKSKRECKRSFPQ